MTLPSSDQNPFLHHSFGECWQSVTWFHFRTLWYTVHSRKIFIYELPFVKRYIGGKGHFLELQPRRTEDTDLTMSLLRGGSLLLLLLLSAQSVSSFSVFCSTERSILKTANCLKPTSNALFCAVSCATRRICCLWSDRVVGLKRTTMHAAWQLKQVFQWIKVEI